MRGKMSRTLHIVRNSDDTKAFECIEAQANDGTLSLLLIQGGIHTKPPLGLKTYLLTDDSEIADIQSDIQPISYDDMLKLLFAHQSVIVW